MVLRVEPLNVYHPLMDCTQLFNIFRNSFMDFSQPFHVLSYPFLDFDQPFHNLSFLFMNFAQLFIVLSNPFLDFGHPFKQLWRPFICFTLATYYPFTIHLVLTIINGDMIGYISHSLSHTNLRTPSNPVIQTTILKQCMLNLYRWFIC